MNFILNLFNMLNITLHKVLWNKTRESFVMLVKILLILIVECIERNNHLLFDIHFWEIKDI